MNTTTRRICKDAILLAVLCVIGMLSLPLGDNIKVSLQFLVVIVICFLSDSLLDSLIITGCYLGLGFLLPIYAGFHMGISPTFGYVIGFVVITIPMYFLMKIRVIPDLVRLAIASLVSLLILYAIGTVFMMLYLNLSLEKTLLVSVLPYIPFDIIKIAVALLIYKMFPKRLIPNEKDSNG